MHRNFLESFAVQKGSPKDLQISMVKAREVEYSKKNFIRVEWPTIALKVACNKPFRDNSPTNIRSYPFKPEKRDLERIRKRISDYEIGSNYPNILNLSVFRYQ